MNITARILRFAVACVWLTLSGCTGDGNDAAGPPGTAIGVNGGTVVGPNGAKVVIPPGALAGDTTINIEQTSVGAPPLPAGLSPIGAMFAFTPHGTRFAVPVTVTLPFDADALPEGHGAPELYKTNSDQQWEPVPDPRFGDQSVSAEITSFSYPQVVSKPLEVTAAPARTWLVADFARGGLVDPFRDEDSQNAFEILDKPYDFGPADMLDPGAPVPDLLPREPRATGRIFASAGGGVYGVSAEAPVGGGLESPIGNLIQFRQDQAYVKKAENASLRLLVTEVRIEAVDGGFDELTPCSADPEDPERRLCDGGMLADIVFHIVVFSQRLGTEFFRGKGKAHLWGWRNHWELSTFDDPLNHTRPTQPLWADDQFNLDDDAMHDGSGSRATIELKEPLPIVIDLSEIGEKEEFVVAVEMITQLHNKRRSEYSYLGAFFRDPQHVDGDVQVITEGLEPIGLAAEPPVVDPTEPAGCAPEASPGSLHFLSPDPFTSEAVGGAGLTLFVARSGGSADEVSATISTSDGSATAGDDYLPVSTTVTFAAGDTIPREVNVPLVHSADAEPDETFELTLSDATGCASLGSPVTAMILDDTREILGLFSLGGTVTGLVGSGLVLSGGDPALEITANGPFAFAQPGFTGLSYDVRVQTQPSNPSQICSVTHGSGTIADANVDDIAVDCVTPGVSAGLDQAFGTEGKTSTPFGGDETAMVLQPDGKIVMVGGSSSGFVLARYDSEGNLDTDFGSGGLVTTDVAGAGGEAHGVALQADGKIVVVGFVVLGLTANNRSNFDFAVVRYDSDGNLDPSFGAGGVVTTDFNAESDQAFAVAIQPDGSIVVAGSAAFNSVSTGPFGDFGVARYLPDGTLDDSFGTGGKLTTDIIGGTDIAHAILIQPSDGAILVAGRVTLANSSSLDSTGLSRYTPSGDLDGSFGADGTLSLVELNLGDNLALQEDGKILLAGNAYIGTSPTRFSHFALMRLAADGSRDGDFGNDGLTTTRFSELDDIGSAVAVQTDGRIIVAGRAGQGTSESNADFALARYDSDGALDASFGTDGKLTIDFFGAFDGAESVALQADGKIVVSGAAHNGSRNGYALARLAP